MKREKAVKSVRYAVSSFKVTTFSLFASVENSSFFYNHEIFIKLLWNSNFHAVIYHFVVVVSDIVWCGLMNSVDAFTEHYENCYANIKYVDILRLLLNCGGFCLLLKKLIKKFLPSPIFTSFLWSLKTPHVKLFALIASLLMQAFVLLFISKKAGIFYPLK